jgi:MFS family permease
VVLYASLTGSLFLLPFLLIYAYGYSAAAAGAAFLPFSAIMAVGLRTAGGLALRVGSRAMLAVGSLVTGSGCALFALSASRPEDSLGFLPGFVLTGIGITACVARLTTAVLDAAPSDLGGSASVVKQRGREAWRPRRCRRARIRLREHVGVSPRVRCGCRSVPARDVDGGGARLGRRVNGNCVARR